MKQRRFITLGSAFLIASALTACSTGDSAETPDNDAEANGENQATEEPEITFIQGVIGDNFYISMECGARDASEEFDVDLTVQGPEKWDAALQQPMLSSVTATNPDAILIAPNDVNALQRPLEEAAENSHIVLVDTTIEDPSISVSEIASDNVGGGAAAFEAIQELVPEGGKVLVIDNEPGISTSDDRVRGFAEAVDDDTDLE